MDTVQPVAINARAAVRREIGGVERFAREMVARLPALRPERYVVVRPPGSLAHRAGHAWEQGVFPLRAAGCKLLYSPANLAPVASRRNVVVIHDAAALRVPRSYSRGYVAYQRRLLPMIVRRARLVITVSEFSRRELVELLGANPECVEVIAGGVDQRFGPDVDRAVVLARYVLEKPYVLVVGTASARKNLAALEPAVAALAAQGVEFVVAGSGRGYLRNAETRLRRLGYVPDRDLPALYAGARALALPSLYEGFGLPCLEAMASGVPVVAARSGALPDTVGEAGLLVEAGDATSFGEALSSVVSDESLRSRLIAAGRARAAQFSWDRTAMLTDNAIGRLLDAE